MVVAYAYLWHHKHRKGQVEGRKVRPSVILVVVQTPKNAAPKFTVAPITHIPPTHADTAIEMPTRGKQALGLDDERSWMMLDEVNTFDWPSYDLHPVPGRKTRFAYGFIPPKLNDTLIVKLLELASARRIATVARD